MKILIEGHKYQTDFIEKNRRLAIWGKEGKTDLIGYFYSHDLKDCVFILPKVILNEDGKIFDSFSPEDIWNVKLFDKDSVLRREQHDFLFRFSIWIYQSINVYNRLNRYNGIVQEETILDIDTSTENARVSYHYEEKIKKLNETIAKMKEVEIEMASKIAKVQKMEALLDRYALHSEIDYDKETYEFINYDERR